MELLPAVGALIDLFSQVSDIRKTRKDLSSSQLTLSELQELNPEELINKVLELKSYSLQLFQGRDIYADEFDTILVYLQTESASSRQLIKNTELDQKDSSLSLKMYAEKQISELPTISNIYRIQVQFNVIANLRSELENGYVELLRHEYPTGNKFKEHYKESILFLKEDPKRLFDQQGSGIQTRTYVNQTLDTLRNILSKEQERWTKEDAVGKRLAEISTDIEKLYQEIAQEGWELNEGLRERYQKARDTLGLPSPDKENDLAEAKKVLIDLQIAKHKGQKQERDRKMAEEEVKRKAEQKARQDERAKLDEKKQTRNRIVFIGIFIVVPVTLFLVVLGLLIWQFGGAPNSVEKAIPFIGVPYSVVLWSALGSIASMLHLVNISKEQHFRRPFRTFRWAVTRPLIGIIMGTVFYLAAYGGLFVTVGEFAPANYVLLWLVAFVGGFSDRAQQALISLVVGKIKPFPSEDSVESNRNEEA